MIFLETSFLVSFYVEKTEDHEKALKLMKKIKNRELILSQMIIYETLTVLKKLKQSDDLVGEVYENLMTMKVYDDTGYYDKALEYTLINNIGFFDNLTYIFMVNNGIKEITSFDNDFDIFDDIERIQ
ncbi:MAG: PIN domain-containing protein [Methanobrevibacter sp.]|jgi:predicted nucleic acid-binding protein|nr:PIN domain-containing protein [Methanobrevibacter sp.]